MSFLKHKMEQHITETADGEYTFGRENVFTETTSDRVVKKENGDKYVDIGLHGEKPYGIHELQYAVTQNPFLGSDYHIERGEEIAFAKNLNKYVDVDDHFIFLGDFDSRHSTPDFDRLKRFFANIKCRNVYLILGNNDSFPVKKYKELGIKAVVDKFEFGNCILTHFPVMVKAPMINIHGHLHGAASPTQKGEKAYWYADPKRCVDVWRDDFSPVRLNDVLANWEEMKKYKSYSDGKMRLLSENKDGDEHMYFYHLVPKGSDVSGGIKSLDWFYKHDKKLFLKYSEKYRDRLVNGWGIYSNTSPEKLTAKMIYDGINKFRGTKDGCNQIYCFYYPPHRYLGEKMRKLLETKDIYRIDIKSDELKNCLKSIDWGYEGSFTGNKKLSENWYKNCTYDDYFSKYDENVTPLFSTLNHISICTKDGVIPEKCLIKIENPEMVLTTESGDDLSNIPEEIVKFNKELCKWDYGVILNGKKYTNSNEIDWSKYKTTPINIIEKEHVGVCWDFVNYQHHYFKDNKIHDESYFYVQQVSDNENDIVTHTFSVITISGTKYWFEAAWGGHKGIHKISSWKDTINVLCEKYNKDKKFPYSVFKYNPDGLDKNIPNSVFFEKATQNLVYDYKGTYTESGDDVFEESVGSYQTKELTRDFIEKFKKNMKALSHIRTNENTKGVMLVDGENCIGFINTEVKDDGVWIQALEVSKEYQHQGYGQKLLEYGIKKLKATKLSVRKSNSHAIKLYKKNGFSVVDENDYQYIMSLGTYQESVNENQFQFIDFKNPKAKSYLEEGEKSYWNEFGDWHIKNSIGEIVIDKENDKLAGYIFVDNKASGQEGFITPLMVIKRYRKNGLGNRLLEDAISKYHAIDLVVKKSNTIALNMYKKHGFVTIGKGNEKGTIYMKLKSKLGKDDQIIEESCKSLKEARELAVKVRELAGKYNANFYFVTDGASATSNSGNPAVKVARDAVAKWERDNGYNDKEDWSDNPDDTSDYMLKKESSDEVLTENVMISRDDIYYGFDKFESGEKNVLLITGFSGSGKSTLAENLSSKYDCDYFMIDSLEFYAGGYMSLDNLKKGEPGCYEFLMKHPKFKETLERDYSGKEYWNILCQYIPWLISWCKKKKPEKFIIEGLQLYETLSEGSVPDTILSNPFIIKGTSGLKSAWRAGKRAGGKELPVEFVRQLKWVFKDNKQLEQLKKALDKEYGESSDEILSGEVVTEEANYNKRNIYPVYIILTDADSPMAKLIKSYTGQPYAHALISFNTDLEPAYSFGCTSIKPFKFGFISKSEEDPFRNEEKAAYVVYVMYVNKMQYTKIQDKLQWFIDNKDKMKYSWGGLLTLGLHIPKQFENQYFCSQFVMDLIGDAIKLPKDPSLWTPGDIEHLQNISLVDKGPDLRYFNKKRFKRNLKYIQKHQFNKMKYESTLGNPNTVVFDFGSVLVKNTSLDAFYKANISESKAKILAKAYFEFIHIDENLPVDKAIELYRKTLPKDLQVYAKTAFRICATSKEKYDYTIPLLKFLKSRGYKLYYLSNWARSGFTLMKQSHIMDFVTLFDGGIVSYEVGLKKPDPNIYKLLITKYDLDPKDCIFYDDKKENCDAARKIGMKAVQFTQDTVKEIMKSPSVINESVDLFSEATDSITNPNLSHYFVEKVGKRVDKVLSDPAKVKEFNNLVRNYINRNITKLTKSGPCDMIPFTDLDHKQFQEMFGFWYNITKTKETSPNEIREYITEYSKLAHAKITFWLNNSSQVLFYFVIRYFTMHPDPKSLNAALSIYTLCIYPVMFHKYFPLGVMEPIMQYTIDNLTEKFLIKKSKHLFDSLLQSIQASYRFHKNNFKNASDKNVADWISRIRNDQNSMLKKISNEYMKNWKDGKAARTTNEEYDSDTPIIDELENGTTAVQNIVQKVTLPIIEEGVDLVRAEAAAKMAQVSISDCRYFLTLIITDSNADLIQKFIESILFLYIYEGKKTERDIRSTYFITWAASLFKKTNSKNPNINTINDILNTWSENSGINKKFSRIASRINYKKAIFYYLILCIQKHV